MSLILDHINGVHNDNRLENLRILCPNCNATLPTHCGRASKKCEVEGCDARTGSSKRKYCPEHKNAWRKKPRYSIRKVQRPPLDVLLREVKENGYSATGRKYGVSDNAVRKWIRTYQSD